MAVVLGILLLLLLLLLLPVRLTAAAATGRTPAVTLRYLFFSWPLYPQSEEEESEEEPEEEEKRPKKGKGDRPKRDLNPLVSELFSLFERLSRPVKRLLRRTGLARVSLRLVVAGEDAAATALRFGRANAVVYSAVAVLDRIFTLRVKEIDIVPGFAAEREEYAFSGEARVIPMAVLLAALQLGFWALAALIKSSITTKKQKSKRDMPARRKEECYGNQASHQ